MTTNISTRLFSAPYDPITGETYFRGRWWQQDETRDLREALERFEYEKEEYERPPRSLTLSEAELYFGDDEEGKENA